MKKIYILFAIILITNLTKAQENVIKTSPLSYIYGRYNIQYERALTENTTINISGSYSRPNLFGMDETVLTLLGTNMGVDFKIVGADFNVDYRIYSKDKGALHGFYIGPYLRWGSLATKVDVSIDVNNIAAGFGINRFGFGFKFGAHWLIKDMISIDWNFGGIGADLYRIITYGEETTIVNGRSYTNPVVDIQNKWMYSYPMNFTIGYAF